MDEHKTKDLLRTAGRYAQSASNYIVCATSWVGHVDEDEPQRDPQEMLLVNLASAEQDARSAIEYIDQIRSSLNSK